MSEPKLYNTIGALENREPTSWDEACHYVVSELAWRAGWYLDGMDNELVEHLYDQGRWDALARACLADLMDTVTGNGMHIDDVVDVLVGKQSDYGPRNILRFGVDGLRVRLWDKIARYNNLRHRDDEAVNESLQDTMLDIVGYVTITAMLELGWFVLPLEKDLS